MALAIGGSFFGLVLLGIAALVYWGSEVQYLLADLNRPVTPLSQARIGDLVRVRAAAHPGPRGPAVSPLSGKPSLFYAIHAYASGRTKRFALERLERDFYVGDSAVWALISAAGMKVYSGQRHLWVEHGNIVIAGAILHGRLSPQQLAFVHARLNSPRQIASVQESRIEPAEVIDVVGVLAALPGGNGLTFVPNRRSPVRVILGGREGVIAELAVQRGVALGLAALGLVLMAGAISYGFFG